jgi:hypothetical protein
MQTETALPPARREISRFPCKKRRHMPGSLTTPGCPSTRVGVLDHIAFRYLYSVGTQDIPIAAQWLACASPADASPLASRPAMHGSGPMRFATPSSCRTSTDYSLPVSRRTEIRTPDPQIRSLVLHVDPSTAFELMQQ